MKWRIIQRILNVSLILASLYVAGVFIERRRQLKQMKDQSLAQQKVLPLSPDYYVVPPKSYVRNLADLQAFAGKPLWVRDGYWWKCPPDTPLGPMERVVATGAYEQKGELWLKLSRGGQAPCSVAVSSKGRLLFDGMFLIKDPREIYKDWTPDTWKKIEERRIEPGMTEAQIKFALGYGEIVPGLSGGDADRVVDYKSGEKHVRVTYAYGVAKRVEGLP